MAHLQPADRRMVVRHLVVELMVVRRRHTMAVEHRPMEAGLPATLADLIAGLLLHTVADQGRLMAEAVVPVDLVAAAGMRHRVAAAAATAAVAAEAEVIAAAVGEATAAADGTKSKWLYTKPPYGRLFYWPRKEHLSRNT